MNARGILLLTIVALLAACSGQLLLTPEEEVRPGDALGFEYINYVTFLAQETRTTQQILEVEAGGRSFFVRSVTENDSTSIEEVPFRFLADEEMLRIRTAFSDSDFFSWSDSIYGDPGQTNQTRKTIVYQEDGRSEDLQRIEDAEVPPSIEVLFDILDVLILESQEFELGTELDVVPFVSGVRTDIDRRDFAVVKSRDDLVDLVRRLGSDEISVLTRVDFSTEMVVAVFLGDVDDRTVGVEFTEIGYEADDVVKVQFVRRRTETACGAGQRPYAMARIPVTAKRVEFYQSMDEPIGTCGS
jgi:hypothetical protein